MEHVLSTDYIKDMILDHVTFKELNHMRVCSRDLQEVVSEYSEQKMKSYLNIINCKISQLRQDTLTTCYEMPYIVVYNYYHAIIKYYCLLLEPQAHTEFQKLMRCFHSKKIVHLGYKYVFDTDRYKKSSIKMHSYSLFEIMTCIYLCNTGNDWASYHWSGEELDVIKFIQGKLLPLS